MNEDFKNELKDKWRRYSKKLLRLIIVPFIVIILLAASLYKVKLDDGTFEEGDWSNTQYAASQYMGNTSIESDGKMATNMTAQELWDKMMDEGSRVDLYLDGPEELLKLMNAQMVTQYLDTRENPDEEIDWNAITDINSNEVQGIIKLKRAQSDGSTITMTYVDPETFQTYIDNYNNSGAESDRNIALSHFTLERTTVANNSGTATPIEAGETINVPSGLGAIHTYMGWQMITSTTSTQYKLREQAGMNFDEEGFGIINGRYVIACTTTFGQVGDYVDFYQADGSIIPCIIGDIKNQNDAGCNEWGHLDGTCIIEFVVDKTTWYNPMHENPGNPNCHPEWNQYITKAVNGGSYFDNPDFGSGAITATNNGSISVQALLSAAKNRADYIRYGDAPINPAINCDAKLVSCDRFVAWVLYDLGLTDQPRTSGLVVKSTDTTHDLSTWLESHGFKKITNRNELQAGDIVFQGMDSSPHVFILGNQVSSTTWERYDGGSQTRIRSTQPSIEIIDGKPFSWAYRLDSATTTSGGNTIGGDVMKWPTDGTTITSDFGLRTSPTAGASSDHRGIDIGVSTGTNVYATESGTVTTAGWSDSAGNWVVIDHGNGYVTKYMHNSEVLVSAGDTVEKGQVIAKSGSTGISTGPHLHFQIEYNGEAVDPLSFKYDNGMGNGTGGIGSSTGESSSASTTKYYAKVATWNEVTDTVESNDPDVESYSTTTYNMTTTNINYEEFVSGYTMPFDYLWDLLVISEDQDFVLDLADLVYDSEIEITVHDNLSVNTNVNTYTYTENEKIISRDVSIVGNSAEGGGRVRSASPSGTQEKVNSVDRTVVHTTITKRNTLDISLTKADVWIVKYTKTYTYEVPDAEVTQGGAGAIADIPYTADPDHTTDTDDIGYGESQRQSYHNQWVQQYPDIVTSLTEVHCDYYYSTTNRNESITNTLEQNNYVEPPKGEIYEKTKKDDTEPNFVTILLKDGNQKAKHHLLGASSWLFDLLEKNDTTAEMVDLTKYLFYCATKNPKYWDPDEEFDFSIFDPDNFASNSGGTSGIDGLPGQIYDFLLQKGVPAVGAAAILGNIQQESSFNSSVVNSAGYSGLCQWGGGRLNNLKSFASTKGTDWTDAQTQIEFMWQELNGSYSEVKNVIMNATNESDMEYATWYFGRYYEIYFIGSWPSSKGQSANRYAFAQEWYAKWQQNHTSGNVSGSALAVANGTAQEKLAYLFPNGTPTTASQCEQYITTVQVAMTNRQGVKFNGNLQVHRAVAQDVQDVFKAAQDGGFKIYEAAGYGFRRMNNGGSGSLSHHSYGIAIDINVTENYSHRGGTVYAGQFWDPSRSEFSIPRDGILVRAFEAKGWKWGGNWSGNYQDYMHFSFTGN